jgi:hypothetical protein
LVIGLSFDDVAKAAMSLNPSAFREKESARSTNEMKYSAYKAQNGDSDFPNGRLLLTLFIAQLGGRANYVHALIAKMGFSLDDTACPKFCA